MEHESLPKDLEGLLSKVKLKEPSRELMADYLAGVNTKIDRGFSGPSFGLPQMGIVLVVGLAFVFGVVYFLALNPKKDSKVEVAQQTQPVTAVPSVSEEPVQSTGSAVQKAASQELSLEDQLTILEALGEEDESETMIEIAGDEELLDETALLDDIEFSAVEAVQAPAVV